MSNALTMAVCERMHLSPVMLAPEYLAQMPAVLQAMGKSSAEDYEQAKRDRQVAMLEAYGYAPDDMVADKPFAYAAGIAFIPVTGMLINRCGWSWAYYTGYNFIRSQLNAAVGDPDVQKIVLDVNTCGGEVAGCFELCDDIYAARSEKEIVAVVDSKCYSAGYAIGSSCTRMIVTPSGGVGSIGVLSTHVDMSKLLDNIGYVVTLITSGEHKADGNPYEKLPDAVKARIQASVDASREQFVALVARNRGLDAKVVRDTEAACYRPEEALTLGLIDDILPPGKAVLSLFDERSRSILTQESDMGATDPKGAGATTLDAATIAAEAHVAERQRIKGIICCEEATGRAALANHLAMNTAMSADDAKAVLAVSPKEAVAASTPVAAGPTQFELAMSTSEHPNVGADASAADGSADGEYSAAERILAAQNAATGAKLALVK